MVGRIARRRLGALGVAVTVVAAGLVAPTPASATAYEDVLVYVPKSGSTAGAVLRNGVKSPATFPSAAYALPGDFEVGSDGQVFVYNPGPGADGIVTVSLSGSGTSSTFSPETVGGTFQPFVGDFDGNSIHDIFWYAPGDAKDYIWLFAPDGSHTTLNTNVSGTYRPIPIQANSDSRTDILWYGVGAVADSIWYFGAGATSKTTKALSIGGTYTTAVGRFGLTPEGAPTDRIVFYSATGADYLWSFNAAGTPSTAGLPALNGDYRLLPGQFFEETYGSLIFYGPGSLPEKLYAFGPGPAGDVSVGPGPNISGTYETQVGDFDTNGFTDIAFLNGTSTTIWKFTFDGTHTQSVFSGLPSNVARVTRAA